MFSFIRVRSKPFVLCLLVLLTSACDSGPQLQPLSRDAVILAFGDSLTYGTGAPTDQSYPAHLQALLSRTVINAGIPGEVSLSGLRRLPALLKRHQPELLILCHGGNDILRRNSPVETRNNLQKMIDLARTSKSQVLLVGVPEFGLFLTAAPFYKELADHNQLAIENEVLSEILQTSSLKADKIHPNSKGYALFAERIQQLLQQSGAL